MHLCELYRYLSGGTPRWAAVPTTVRLVEGQTDRDHTRSPTPIYNSRFSTIEVISVEDADPDSDPFSGGLWFSVRIPNTNPDPHM